MSVTTPDWDNLVTRNISPPGPGVAALSADPVRTAALAMADPHDDVGVYILGEDGRWRRLDVPDLRPVSDGGGNQTAILRPASLNADGTRLALPQPDELVVVDLTTGSATRYDVPGPHNAYVIWEGDSHVFVGEENRRRGRVVDLVTSAVTLSTHGPSTRVLPDGRALTWAPGDNRASAAPSTPVMRWDGGQEVPTSANNSAGWFPQPPLAHGGVAIGLHRMWQATTGRPETTSDPALDELLRTTDGVVAVDVQTGRVLAFLRLGDENLGEDTTLLGWRGDLPVLGLVNTGTDGPPLPTHLILWDYAAATLEPLGVVPSPWVAWGTGT